MSEKLWFVMNDDGPSESMTSSQLKQLARDRRITIDTKIRLGEDGQWSSAGRVKGLFADQSVRGQLIEAAPKVVAVPQPTVLATPPPQPARVSCSFCGEEIASTAIKCRHCNEFLDGRPREQPQPQQAIVMQAAPVNVQLVNHTQVQQLTQVIPGGQRWSPIVAMLLSLLIPGLGQMYKGQVLNGIVWFCASIVGYIAFILPGLVIHLCCVVGAGMGDPHR